MKKEKNGRFARALRRILRAALFVLSIPARILGIPIRFYRRFLSSAKAAPTCRFSPTCSEYALISLREWGLLIGTVLTVWRVLRCNPFSRGGEDPVPENPIRRRIQAFLEDGERKTIPDEERT